MFDAHVHSVFSLDGQDKPEAFCRTALDKGLSYLCFTEHVDYMHPLKDFTLNYPAYFDAIEKLKAQYHQTPLEVGMGLEAGYLLPSLQQTIVAAKALPYDAIIWSVHAVDGYDVTDAGYFQNKPKETAYRRYLEEVYQSLCVSFDGYQIVGHLGYVTRRAPYADPALHYDEFPKLLDAILKKIIARDKALEVNTGRGILIPSKDILARYYALGGRKVCYGSDAHQVHRVHNGFASAVSLLSSVGFTHLTYYQKQRPVAVALEDCL